MSGTGHLDVSVDVAAPAQVVWDYVTHWERQSEWIPLTSVRVDGEIVVARTALGPVGFDDVMEVTTWDPPYLCETLHTGTVVKGIGIFRVTPKGSGCTFTWGERAEVPGGPLAPYLWPLAKPFLHLAFAYSLRRLRARVESGT
ncbi:SRPBCC family protein [Solicola sp. PLA-1-18]|uniref:SRPBCC family protein n=1 Tax=Solicola sp. PLA-1-18 TaxID=3380532 RepID=UPI003B7C36D5